MIDTIKRAAGMGDPFQTFGEVDSDLGDIFETLSNRRRREIVRHVIANDDGSGVTLSELSEHVAALENDTTVRALTSTQRKRVYVSFYQCHLPQMDEAGLVDFNKDRGIIQACNDLYAANRILDGSIQVVGGENQ